MCPLEPDCENSRQVAPITALRSPQVSLPDTLGGNGPYCYPAASLCFSGYFCCCAIAQETGQRFSCRPQMGKSLKVRRSKPRSECSQWYVFQPCLAVLCLMLSQYHCQNSLMNDWLAQGATSLGSGHRRGWCLPLRLSLSCLSGNFWTGSAPDRSCCFSSTFRLYFWQR